VEVPATAGFGLRLIAQLIDGLVYGLLTIMIAIGLYLIIHFHQWVQSIAP